MSTTEQPKLEEGVWTEGPDGELIPDYESTFPTITEGEVVHGTVVRVDKDEVLVDIGYKSEGVIPVAELSIRRSVNPADEVSLGDEIDALVLTKEDAEGRLILSKKRARFELAWKKIEGAAESGEPVLGRVIEVVKGGLILDLGVRGFLPASLVDIRRVQDLDEFMGTELRAKVIELNRSRNNVVLSRRAVLEDERKEQRQQILDRLQPGDVVEGQISNIVDFGAFVDLDGMDGLIHISELSWSHVNHPSEMLEIGQTVSVKVLDIDRDRQRISLGLKQTQSDPWQQVLEQYKDGDVVDGKVTKVVTFGAFVEILPGVEGLVHISELAQHHVENPREVVSQGDSVKVLILEVDGERRRLSLSLKRVGEDGTVSEAPELGLSDEVFTEARAATAEAYELQEQEAAAAEDEPAAAPKRLPRRTTPPRTIPPLNVLSSRSPAGSAPGRAKRCVRSHVTAPRRRAPTRSSTGSTQTPRCSGRSSSAGVTTCSPAARSTESGSARSSSPTATSWPGSSRCCIPASWPSRRVGASEQTAPLAVVEMPLLYETGGEERFDAVVVITAPEETRRGRTDVADVTERQGRLLSDEEKARARRLRLRERRLARGARRLRPERRAASGSVTRVVTLFLLVAGIAGAGVFLSEPDWYLRARYPLRYEHIVRGHAENYRLDPALVAAVIYQESRFKPEARSEAGAVGLMQLLPETAKGIAARTGGSAFRVEDLDDPEINVRYGSWYLRHLLDKYGTEERALAAYNGGQGNVDRGVMYPETRHYVDRVLELRGIYREAYASELGE